MEAPVSDKPNPIVDSAATAYASGFEAGRQSMRHEVLAVVEGDLLRNIREVKGGLGKRYDFNLPPEVEKISSDLAERAAKAWHDQASDRLQSEVEAVDAMLRYPVATRPPQHVQPTPPGMTDFKPNQAIPLEAHEPDGHQVLDSEQAKPKLLRLLVEVVPEKDEKHGAGVYLNKFAGVEIRVVDRWEQGNSPKSATSVSTLPPMPSEHELRSIFNAEIDRPRAAKDWDKKPQAEAIRAVLRACGLEVPQ